MGQKPQTLIKLTGIRAKDQGCVTYRLFVGLFCENACLGSVPNTA